ncbi:MAG: hypothetical protein ACXVX7_08305 [Mycobacterium sp.]
MAIRILTDSSARWPECCAPGGMLLYADVRQWYRYGGWEAALANAALRVVSC